MRGFLAGFAVLVVLFGCTTSENDNTTTVEYLNSSVLEGLKSQGKVLTDSPVTPTLALNFLLISSVLSPTFYRLSSYFSPFTSRAQG